MQNSIVKQFFPTYNQQSEMQPIVINSVALEKESLTMLYGSLKVC